MTSGEQDERGARAGSGRTTWADVELRAAGEPVDQATTRRAKNRRVWIAGFILGVVAVAGIAFGWLVVGDGTAEESARPHPDAPSDHGVLFVLGAVLLVAGLAVWVTGAIRLARTDGFPWAWREPTVGLPRRERQVVERTLRGRVEPDPARIPTLRHLAALRIRQSRFTLVLLSGWVLMALGQACNRTFPWSTWFWLVLAAWFAVILAIMLRNRSGWRAFIAAHPDDAATAGP